MCLAYRGISIVNQADPFSFPFLSFLFLPFLPVLPFLFFPSHWAVIILLATYRVWWSCYGISTLAVFPQN